MNRSRAVPRAAAALVLVVAAAATLLLRESGAVRESVPPDPGVPASDPAHPAPERRTQPPVPRLIQAAPPEPGTSPERTGPVATPRQGDFEGNDE